MTEPEEAEEAGSRYVLAWPARTGVRSPAGRSGAEAGQPSSRPSRAIERVATEVERISERNRFVSWSECGKGAEAPMVVTAKVSRARARGPSDGKGIDVVGTPAPALRPGTVLGRLERSFQELAVMVGCYLEDFRLMLEAANCGMVAVDAADRSGLVEDIARWHRIERLLGEAKLNLPTDPKARRRALEDAIVVALAFSRGDIVPRPIFLPSGQAAERFMRIEGALFEIYGPDWREVMGARKHPDVDRSAAAERGRWLH